jgi:hypothetical protein
MTAQAGVLVTSVVESYLCGLRFGRVDAIEDTLRGGTEPAIDLSAVWGVQAAGEAPRRAVTVHTSLGRRRVVLGELTRVCSIPRSSFAPLPPFIDGVADRAAIEGVFFVDERLGFLVDVDRLAAFFEPGPADTDGEPGPADADSQPGPADADSQPEPASAPSAPDPMRPGEAR